MGRLCSSSPVFELKSPAASLACPLPPAATQKLKNQKSSKDEQRVLAHLDRGSLVLEGKRREYPLNILVGLCRRERGGVAHHQRRGRRIRCLLLGFVRRVANRMQWGKFVKILLGHRHWLAACCCPLAAHMYAALVCALVSRAAARSVGSITNVVLSHTGVTCGQRHARDVEEEG